MADKSERDVFVNVMTTARDGEGNEHKIEVAVPKEDHNRSSLRNIIKKLAEDAFKEMNGVEGTPVFVHPSKATGLSCTIEFRKKSGELVKLSDKNQDRLNKLVSQIVEEAINTFEGSIPEDISETINYAIVDAYTNAHQER